MLELLGRVTKSVRFFPVPCALLCVIVLGTARISLGQPAPVLNDLSSSPPGLSRPVAILYGLPFELVVNGQNFQSPAQIVIGTATLPTMVISGTKLTANISSALQSVAGTFSVRVVNPDGQTSNPIDFKVVVRGDIDGNRAVTIGDAVKVAMNAAGLDRPPLSPDAGDINLTGSVNVADALALARFSARSDLNLPSPTIDSASAVQVNVVNISGTGFSTTAQNNQILFRTQAGVKRVVATSSTATTLTATLPGAVSGLIQVYRLDVSLGSLEFPMSVPNTPTPTPPMLASIGAGSGKVPSGTKVNLYGMGFDPDAEKNVVTFRTPTGTVDANEKSVNQMGMQLTAIVPQGASCGGVFVKTPNGTTRRRALVVSGSMCQLELFDILGGGSAGDILVLHGTGFDWSTPSNNTVRFASALGTVTAAVVQAGETELQVRVPDTAVTGPVTVMISGNTSNSIQYSDAKFGIPALTAISPSSGLPGTVVMVTLTGQNFVGGASVSVSGTGVTVSSVSVSGSTSLTAEFSISAGATLGNRDVTVTTLGGTTEARTFIIKPPPPTLTNINPPSGDQGRSMAVLLTGSNFVSGATAVALSGTGVTVNNVVVTSATTLTATFVIDVSALSGTRNVTVTTPGGVTGALPFTVRDAPISTIIVLDPVTGEAVKEVTVKEGMTVALQVRLFDINGRERPDIPVKYSSLDPAVAKISSSTLSGIKAGFSTLQIFTTSKVETAMINVVQITPSSGTMGTDGVAADLSHGFYLTSSATHTILRAEQLNQTPALYAGMENVPGLISLELLNSLFRNPTFLALDQPGGSLYVSDSSNNVIRQISTGTGKVERLAGDAMGHPGTANGDAGSASFMNPQGIALDNVGNLWIVDSGNNAIRRINLATKNVELVAGGTPGSNNGIGTSAQFNSPTGIALESEVVSKELGFFYGGEPPGPVRMLVADTGNGLIRRVFENGQVETLNVQPAIQASLVDRKAGGPLVSRSQSFSSPTGIAFDPFGNLYVSETSSGRVKVILRNGDVVAAAPANTFVRPKGLVIAEGGTIVVASANSSVQEVRYGQPQIRNVQPGRLGTAGGETVVITGNNFATDTIVIVRGKIVPAVVENTGRISFVAPPSLPYGLATLTVQNRGGLAQEAVMVGAPPLALMPPGFVTTIAGGGDYIGDGKPAISASLSSPSGVVLDSQGNLYVLDKAHFRIRRIDPRTGLITTIAGNGSPAGTGDGGLALLAGMAPKSITLDGAGNLYLMDSFSIRKIDKQTRIITTLKVLVPQIEEIAADGAGNVYFVDTPSNSVFRISNGAFTQVAGRLRGTVADYNPASENGPAVDADIMPRQIALDAAGDLYITDDHNARVFKVTFSGSSGTIKTLVTVSTADPFRGISVGPAGRVFYSRGCNIYRILGAVELLTAGNTTCGFVGQVGSNGEDATIPNAFFRNPAGLAVDSTGRVYIADSGNNRLRVYAAPLVKTLVGNGGNTQLFAEREADLEDQVPPRSVVADGSGNVFISSFKIAADTGGLKTATTGGDVVIAADEAGNYFVWSFAGIPRVRRVSVVDGTVIPIDPFPIWQDVAVDSDNIYFVDKDPLLKPTITRINVATGVKTALTTVSSGLSNLLAIAVDRTGNNLYIAERDGNRIRRLTSAGITTIAGTGVAGFSGDGGSAIEARLQVDDIAVASDGRIFISGGGRIRMISNGIIRTVVGGGTTTADGVPGTSAEFTGKTISVDAAGNVYFGESTSSPSGAGRLRVVRRPP